MHLKRRILLITRAEWLFAQGSFTKIKHHFHLNLCSKIEVKFQEQDNAFPCVEISIKIWQKSWINRFLLPIFSKQYIFIHIKPIFIFVFWHPLIQNLLTSKLFLSRYNCSMEMVIRQGSSFKHFKGCADLEKLYCRKRFCQAERQSKASFSFL